MAHARLQPSAAERWTRCPGSVALATVAPGGPRDPDSADQGTACHAVLAGQLRRGDDFVPPSVSWDEEDAAGRGVTKMVQVTAEMAGWVGEVRTWVRDYAARAGLPQQTSVEQWLPVGEALGLPEPGECFGTADLLLATPDELLVLDAKFGHGDVPVEDNPQLLLYALGAQYEYAWMFPRVRLVIHQPRSGGAKEQVVEADQLRARGEDLRASALAALAPGAPRAPSDAACMWCPAAGICPERQEAAIALANQDFGQPAALAFSQVLAILDRADDVRAALAAVEEHARRMLLAGQAVPGWKLVYGNKHRAWKDREEASATLEDLGYRPDDYAPRKMITPAQAEKLVGHATSELLAPLWERPRGEPTLAREADAREPVAPEFPTENQERTP